MALPNVYLPTREPIAISPTNTVPPVWREFFKTVQASIQGPIDLSEVTLFTGILPFVLGGTGTSATPTAGGIAYGTGTALAWTAAGTDGQVWKSNGSAGPTAQNLFTSTTITTTGTINAQLLSGATLLRMNNNTLATLNGIVPTYDAQLLEIVAVGTGDVVLADEAGAASAANRLNTNLAGNVTLQAGTGRAWAVYDGTTARWRILGWFPATGTYSAIKTITSADSPYTVLDSDGTILCDATSGAITVNLEAVAAQIVGRIMRFKKTDSSANAVTVTAFGAETIDGAGTVSLPAQYNHVTIQANASAWWVF